MDDKQTLSAKGITESTLREQLERFHTGFPFLKLAGAASVGNGILRLTEEEEQSAINRWEKFLKDGGSVTKFVPASGAASRMFKALFAFANDDSVAPTEGSDIATLLDKIDSLPFREELDLILKKQTGKTAAELKAEKQYKTIVKAIIYPDGLNYGALPKGLLTFHRYADGSVRTPLEEQMTEGAQTAESGGNVNLHFTVSADHRKLFENKIEQIQSKLEDKLGVRFNIGFSEQKPSTDTVAVNPDNTIFRDEKGQMVFRPGGHGALIENLGDIDSEVVFIKNIDNVVPDDEREATIRYKKILAGVLIEAHDTVATYLAELYNGTPDRKKLLEMVRVLENTFCTHREDIDKLDDRELSEYLKVKLDRPMRVCGMVLNEGEPGGGPYLAYNADGTYSPQILESTQIDKNNQQAMQMMATATHFNPVDLACYIHKPDGSPYQLREYVDHNTGFISEKSAGGRELRALELPGLWNGAMSDWLTIFIEVPISTFNPVKTVNDLLRPVHQADK